MKAGDWSSLALGLATLNLVAFAFASGEYMLGVERFYPLSPVTAIIYGSNDVAGQYLRIPATFVTAHVYAGTMVATMPLLIGSLSRGVGMLRRFLLSAGLGVAIVGILLANARIYVVSAAVIAVASILLRRTSARTRLICCGAIAASLLLAFSNERMQRFTSLSDTDYVTERIHGSVNRTFFEVLIEHPMGNGLGGGGTSLPSFLEGQVKNPIAMENEYGRILSEQGIIGLLCWAGFIGWFLTSSKAGTRSSWMGARKLTWCWCALSFGLSMIGTGTMTSIPTTALLMLGVGWVMVPPSDEEDLAVRSFVPADARTRFQNTLNEPAPETTVAP